MIINGEKWHYLAVKKLSALLRGITSKHYYGFYCLNYLHSFRTKNKPELYKRLCENRDFCDRTMPSEDTKILEFNQYQKSDKTLYMIFTDLECLIKNIDGCKKNSENPFTTKVSKHIPSGFSMSTISSFRGIENKHDVHRGKDCMKKFCESLRKHAMKTTKFQIKNKVINKRAAGII